MNISRMIKPSVTVIFITLFIGCILLWCFVVPDIQIYRTKMTRQYDLEGKKLVQVLKAASLPSRTVIITILDKSWASPGSVLDLFLESFRIGERTKHLINHLVIAALDSQAFQYCQSIHLHCFQLTGKSLRTLNSPEFNHGRNQFLLQVLQFGYNLVYTDADVIWLRNPFPLFDSVAEISIGCEPYTDNQHSNNGGFFHMKSDEIMIQFLKFLNLAKVLYPFIGKMSACEMFSSQEITETVALRVKFIETTYYGGLCQPSNWNLSDIHIMHANCRDNPESKIRDLKLVLDESRKIKEVE